MRNHSIDAEQEQVFRTHCSVRPDVPMPSDTTRSEDDVRAENKDAVPLSDRMEEEEEADEAWDLVK
eukprot:scaffold6377_cov76-Amphora_coffeaeformis.AAC.1